MPQPNQSLFKSVKAKQGEISTEMAALSKKYGVEVFRLAGQRFFKKQIAEASRLRQIEELEAEIKKIRSR